MTNYYLGIIQSVANQLPVKSLVDTTLNWMESQKLLDNATPNILSGFNENSIDSLKQIVSRIVCAYLYPKISPAISLVNASIGIIHLGIGFTERFRTTTTAGEEPDKWNTIAMNIHKGFAHLLVAGYDFGIGFLLKQHYIGLVGMAAFAFVPAWALFYHQMVFLKKPEDVKSIPPAAVQPNDQSRVINDLIEFVKPHFQTTEALIREHIVKIICPASAPALETTSEKVVKVVPTYLDSACLIYIIAKKITLELMPNTEPEKRNMFTSMYHTVKRVSGFGAAPTLPDYGL